MKRNKEEKLIFTAKKNNEKKPEVKGVEKRITGTDLLLFDGTISFTSEIFCYKVSLYRRNPRKFTII
jgi:hypothetical protein